MTVVVEFLDASSGKRLLVSADVQRTKYIPTVGVISAVAMVGGDAVMLSGETLLVAAALLREKYLRLVDRRVGVA